MTAPRPPLPPRGTSTAPASISRAPLKILITGSQGQIGWEVVRALTGTVEVLTAARSDLDFERPESIPPTVTRLRPDVIINAAGYTAVDRAESEPHLAHRINAEAVTTLAETAATCGAALVHFSTDYVFDGAKRTPYLPEDTPNPQSVYAASKLAGERAILDSHASAIILRTCWVYGLRGRNFVLAILNQAQSKPELRIVADQVGSPTWGRAVARAAAQIAVRHIAGSPGQRTFAGKQGIYHLGCAGHTSWFEFARAVFEEALVPAPSITPISSAEYAAKAARPAYSVLDCSRTTAVFGITLPPWREALRQAFLDSPDRIDAPRHRSEATNAHR